MMELACSSETLVHICKTIRVCRHMSRNYNLNWRKSIYGWNFWLFKMLHGTLMLSVFSWHRIRFSKEWWRETLGTHYIRSGADTHILPVVNYACWVAFLRKYEEVFVSYMNCWEFVCMFIEQVVDWLGSKHSAPRIGIYFAYCIFSRDYFVFVNARKYSETLC
jgi:hypothetical protein